MKRLKYKPVKQNEIVDVSLAFSQSAALLDKVAEYALEKSDFDTMLKVADRWIDIGKVIFSQAEDEHIDTNDKAKYGFCIEEGVIAGE